MGQTSKSGSPMNLGVFAFWILVGLAAGVMVGFPAPLCMSICAVGTAITVVVYTKAPAPLLSVVAINLWLVVRYVILARAEIVELVLRDPDVRIFLPVFSTWSLVVLVCVSLLGSFANYKVWRGAEHSGE